MIRFVPDEYCGMYSKYGSHDVKEESYLTNGGLFACSCNVKFNINSASKIRA